MAKGNYKRGGGRRESDLPICRFRDLLIVSYEKSANQQISKSPNSNAIASAGSRH
jgi:hypothetical protein